jgi:tRNA 2-thiouridine synthesizing protein E
MNVQVSNRTFEIDDQGWLLDPDQWSEEFAEWVASSDELTLYDESWGLIGYFREYYSRYNAHPSMRQLVLTLGRQHGPHFHDRKVYERFLYRLFPRDPIRELCKLAGLPKPEPDT